MPAMAFSKRVYRMQSNLCGFIILFVYIWDIGNNFIGCSVEYDSLKNYLLRNYSRKSRVSTDIEVTLLFDAQHITKMDEKYGILSVKGKFMMEWFDEDLQWDPTDFDDLKAITMLTSEVWYPEIQELFSTLNNNWSRLVPVLVYHTGTVKWFPSADFDTPCTVNIKNYPYDVQKCVLQFKSCSTFGNTESLKIFDLPLNAIERRVGGEWKFLNVTHKRIIALDFRQSRPIILVEIVVHRTTSSSIYWYSYVIPQVVCCLVTLAEFWLGVSDLHRSIIACCNMIAFLATFFHLSLMAPSSNGTPIIVVCSSVFTSASAVFLLETIVCSVITRSTRPPPKYLVSLARRYGIQNSCCTEMSSSRNYCHRSYSTGSDTGSDHGLTSFNDRVATPDDWYLISAALDRLIFWFYCLTYLITIGIMLSI